MKTYSHLRSVAEAMFTSNAALRIDGLTREQRAAKVKDWLGEHGPHFTQEELVAITHHLDRTIAAEASAVASNR
jgi:hypothetical protein